MNFKSKHLVFCTIFALLTSCCLTNASVSVGTGIELSEKTQYGIWKKENCELSSKRAGTKIKITDFYSKDKKARVVMLFDNNLAEKPEFKIYGLEDYDIELTGTGDVYSFELQTDIIDQARMVLDDTFIQVSYRPEGMDYYRKAIFSLKEVPQAMLDIEKTCK